MVGNGRCDSACNVAADAPMIFNKFVFLTRDGFYYGTTSHRVIPDLMAPVGDPTGDGQRGGPSYKFADEFTHRKHVMGAL